MADLWKNQILIISISSWAIAQIIKVIIVLIQEKRIAWNFVLGSGGMPSSHTATVASLATSVGLTAGLGSIYFSIAAVLAIIVIYDATGVRQSVGQHSVVLNRIVREFNFQNTPPGNGKSPEGVYWSHSLASLDGSFVGDCRGLDMGCSELKVKVSISHLKGFLDIQISYQSPALFQT